MKKYVLDSNIFIQSHRSHYPFDVFPGFWKKLVELANRDIIISIDKVKNELYHNEDALTKWCKESLPDTFFKDTTECLKEYADLANWAGSNQQYTQQAKDEFLQTELADSWLAAFAMKNNYILVTHEVSQPQIRNRIKIPEVCHHFEVQYIPLIKMFRELRETF